jgi:uncharacterized membrane protein
VFLFFLSLFPFATLWIGMKGLSHFSTALYAVESLLPGISYSVLSTLVRKQSAAPPHTGFGKQITSIVMYLMAIPVAYRSPAVSLAMISVVACDVAAAAES